MRTAIWVVTLAAIAVAEIADEPWAEEEDLSDQYDYKDEHDRTKREAYVEGPFEEHVRVKRGCEEAEERVKRSAEYVRRPRQVHQYEVHEVNDEAAIPARPFEEMLAASAEHYHKVYAPAPKARSLSPEVSAGPLTFSAPASSDPIKLIQAPVFDPEYVTNIRVDNANQPLDGADLSAAAGHHHQQKEPHSFGYSKGGGRQHQGNHHGASGGKTVKGSNSDHYVDKGKKGHKTDENHRKEYEEATGQKKKHHDRANHKGSHDEQAFGQRGSHFGEKKAHKKGHKTKGYHNKYHKDEFHKEHKFYDDYHKGGDHHRYGKFNAKHASNESGKKKAMRVNAGHDFVEHGKKGYSNKGHLDADHRGYKGQKGHEEHHQEHSQHGKKGGKQGGSQWGHAKKN